jgi:DNA polymerase-1
LVFDVHKDEIELIKPLIADGMRNALPLTVPVEVEIGVGANWLQAH